MTAFLQNLVELASASPLFETCSAFTRNTACVLAKSPKVILFDKFHVIRHLGKALNELRKAEYARVRQAAALHQVPGVHAALQSREPEPGSTQRALENEAFIDEIYC